MSESSAAVIAQDLVKTYAGDVQAVKGVSFTVEVGISDILDRPVATYSGGQRRRMEIVRALLSDPKVLFLDEPTVGLDTRIRHDLFDAIDTLRERTGVTIIMATLSMVVIAAYTVLAFAGAVRLSTRAGTK